MKKFRKIIATALSVACLLSTFAFAGCGEKAIAPDYSDTEVTFERYAYSATYDGWWRYADATGTHEETEGIVVTDKASLQEYKDCGFNTLFITYTYQLKGAEFKGSKVEQIMDWAHELDMKCILWENTTYLLSYTAESLINPEKADGKKFFNTQEELNAYVYENIKDIIAHPAYYGFSLKDEPNREYLPAIGQVYKAIEAAKPGSFTKMNLWAFTTSPAAQWQSRYSENYATQTPEQNYIDYLNTYKECTGAPYVQYDDYPLQGDNPDIAGVGDDWVNVNVNHLKNYRIVSEWARKNGVEMKKVLQSSSYNVSDDGGTTWKSTCRDLTKTDMYWQTNIAMAFGQKSFTYWTYYPVVNVGASEKYDDSTCFIDQYGTKNDMYFWMKGIHAEMDGMAKALMNFEYNAVTKVARTPRIGQIDYIGGIEKTDLELIADAKSETSGIAIITELYDEENDRYGYFIVNVTDPTEKSEMEISFKVNGYKNVQVYNRGEVENEKLKDGLFEVELQTGEGVFVIPY